MNLRYLSQHVGLHRLTLTGEPFEVFVGLEERGGYRKYPDHPELPAPVSCLP